MKEGSLWQYGERCGVVLREVFAWLSAVELSRAGAACGSWRAAAADDTLWRRLLLRAGAHPALLTLARHARETWRDEYVRAYSPWRRIARLEASATLQHAALSPDTRLLALAASDATLTVWERGNTWDAWWELWSICLRSRGWVSVARVTWSEAGRGLLLAGPLALVPDWELLVLRPAAVEDTHQREWCVAARARCSAGAAGCWADATGAAFISLELRRLAPRLAVTAVRLNSASQETHSEFTGVTVPLMLIFNEDSAHVAHSFVIDSDANMEYDEATCKCDGVIEIEYLRALRTTFVPITCPARLLVASGGTWIGVWPLRAPPLPPPVLAGASGELAERVRWRRERRDVPDPEPLEPDEASVRAACTEPTRRICLPAPLEGLSLHPGCRCAWAVTSDGTTTCVSIPTLRVLRVLAAATFTRSVAAPPPAHYVQSGSSSKLVARPSGAYSSRVRVWSARSGAPGVELRHGAPALCALLPTEGDTPVLLVAATDALHVWWSRATPQPPPE